MDLLITALTLAALGVGAAVALEALRAWQGLDDDLELALALEPDPGLWLPGRR